MKKNVLHVVEAFGGGVFTFLVDLLNATSDDYNITLACAIRPQTPDNYQDYFNSNIKIIELKEGGRNINPIKDIKFFNEVKSIIRQENPDIIHLHSSKAGFVGRLAANKKHKVLYNPHGFSHLKEDESSLKKMIYKGLEWIAAQKQGLVIGVSEGEYQEALKITSRSCLINNGIDIDRLPQFPTKSIEKHSFTVATVGRISYQKNPQQFNEIAKRFPNIRFNWIGDGELRDVLDSPNITVTGWKNKKEVLQLLQQSDIFLLTSLWEGLPIALLEAMYYKKLCIVSNVIGNKDVIENSKNGFIANDTEEFVLIIKNLLNGTYNMSEISDSAHKCILEKYNFRLVENSYRELYLKYSDES